MSAASGPIGWPDLELEIPDASPVAVCAPAYATWLERARANRASLDAATVEIGGLPLGELRRAARDEVRSLATAYTRALGLAVPGVGTDLVLCTGHQPILAHPGIWIKVLALARLVPPGGFGLNLIVDSDAVEEIAAEVPRADGWLRRERVVLARAAADMPAEALPAPSAGQWQAFIGTVDAAMQTIGEPAVVEGWARARRLPPPPQVLGLPGAVTAARRAVEGPHPYLDLPVSWLARTPAFRCFVLSIVREASRFAALHNAILAAYRAHYGIRTGAQPFPDLAVEPGRVELPFWLIAEGRRLPLFASGGRLHAGDRDVGAVPDGPDDAAFAALAIRPRALALTAFARLAICDLFVHGIGGGRYDRATDAIMRAFFGVAPPAYATATATLHLPFAHGGPAHDDRGRLQRLLLDLHHNPDRFLAGDGGPHQALVDEKWALIRRLEGGAALTRRERRAATQRIREVNLALQAAVADRIAEAEEALRRHERRQVETEVTGYRGYPFLFFPVEAVEALVTLLADAPPGEPSGDRSP